MPNPGEERIEWVHTWVWTEENPYRGHWKSTKGNLVRIFPPVFSAVPVSVDDTAGGVLIGMDVTNIKHWTVMVCDTKVYPLIGNDAEERAFCIAETFTRQQR